MLLIEIIILQNNRCPNYIMDNFYSYLRIKYVMKLNGVSYFLYVVQFLGIGFLLQIEFFVTVTSYADIEQNSIPPPIAPRVYWR
jgi:hypothetical protein